MQNAQILELRPQNTQVIEYNITDTKLAELKAKNTRLLMEWDQKDFEPIKTAKREVLKLRTGIEPLRKQYNEEALAHQRRVNAEAKRITAVLEEIEKPLDSILEAEKTRIEAERQAKIEAEQKRVANIKARIAFFQTIPLQYVNKSAELILSGITALEQDIQSDTYNYEELSNEALVAKCDTIAKMQAMYEERITFEKQQQEEAAAAEAKRLAQIAEDERLAAIREEQEKIRFANEAAQARLDEERRAFEAEKAAEEKRKFDEARRLEREKQEAAMSIIPASNEDRKIYIDPAKEGSETCVEATFQNGELVGIKDLGTTSHEEKKINTLPPSPWKWQKVPSACSDLWQLLDAKGNEILLVEEVSEPVRNLIATASELLAACKNAEPFLRALRDHLKESESDYDGRLYEDGALKKLQTAIAKAEGE
jgi:hypothetical protein